MIQTLEHTVPLIESKQDTWIWNQDTGSWIIVLDYDLRGLPHEVSNEWYATTLAKTLNAFSHLARPWRIHFGPFDPNADAVIHTWQQEAPYDDYMNNALKIIRSYPTKIYEIGVDIDLLVHVHTKNSLDKPVQTWVRLPHNEFCFHGGLGHGEPYLQLNISYTLFGPADKHFSPITGPYPEPEEGFNFNLDNNELQLLNQPLLEKALRSWESSFGPINEEGIPGIKKYGFLVEKY